MCTHYLDISHRFIRIKRTENIHIDLVWSWQLSLNHLSLSFKIFFVWKQKNELEMRHNKKLKLYNLCVVFPRACVDRYQLDPHHGIDQFPFLHHHQPFLLLQVKLFRNHFSVLVNAKDDDVIVVLSLSINISMILESSL